MDEVSEIRELPFINTRQKAFIRRLNVKRVFTRPIRRKAFRGRFSAVLGDDYKGGIFTNEKNRKKFDIAQ